MHPAAGFRRVRGARVRGFLRRLAALPVFFLAACAGTTAQFSSPPRELYAGNGMFGEIIVKEDARGLRTLEFERGGTRHSVVKPGDPGHLELEYSRIALVSLALLARPPERLLVVGLGGGSLPMFLRAAYPRAHIDVAEIDPAVVAVAERFFGFVQDAELRAHVGDGRQFIERAAPSSYDIVLLDAFDARAVPRHLTTREFMLVVRRALRPDGVVVANVWGPDANASYHSMLATVRSAFDELYLVYAPNDVNVLAFALPRAAGLGRDALAARAHALGRPPLFRYDLGRLVAQGWLDPAAALRPAALLHDEPPR